MEGNKRLQDELDWVDNHPQHYKDQQHMEDVKHNITVNYEIRKLEAKISTLRRSLRIPPLRYTSIKCPTVPSGETETAEEKRQRILNTVPDRVDYQP